MDLPPPEALRRPKPVWRQGYDLLASPARMVFLPDHWSERLGLTSLRAERLAATLPHIQGRLLDIGAGDNALVRLYQASRPDVATSVGIDVEAYPGGGLVVPSCERLPFSDASFDTVSFLACLNHIPERAQALREAHRVLKPGGRLLVTMISRFLGKIGHAIWWYSEEKHRHTHEDELMGMDDGEVRSLLTENGFTLISAERFLYRLNCLYIAKR